MQRFPVGRSALYELERQSIHPLELVGRHAQLDPGVLGGSDQAANERALIDGSRLFSAYVYGGDRYYVITEYDRSLTTVMLASDY